MLCKRCGRLMSHVMRFEKGKTFELERCPYCHIESKPVLLKSQMHFNAEKDKPIKEGKHKDVKKSSKKK